MIQLMYSGHANKNGSITLRADMRSFYSQKHNRTINFQKNDFKQEGEQSYEELSYYDLIDHIIKTAEKRTQEIIPDSEIHWHFSIYLDACFSGQACIAAKNWKA